MSVKPPPPPLRSAKRLTTPPGAAERRQFPRYALVAQVQLRLGGEVYLLDVGNISAGGLLAVSGEAELLTDLRLGATVSVFVDIGDDAEARPISIDAEATVVRIDRGGPGKGPAVAFKWVSADTHFADRLERLIGRIDEVAEDE